MKKIILLAMIFVFILQSVSLAYDSINVHPTINSKATMQSILETQDFLKKLGFSKGLLTELITNNETKTIIKWIEQGGTGEDGPLLRFRYLRHFHDPLKNWDTAGLDIPLQPTYRSSIEWAQLPTETVYYPNWYSWDWARYYYYQALITNSEEYFAETFLRLGHVMHLVADLAVPAHVRNDSHPGGIFYTWKKDPYEIWTAGDGFDKLNFAGTPVDPSIFSKAVSSGSDFDLAPAPISALWDQNKYLETNPDVTWGSPSEIGLAEYTNANFFSKDTIFTDYNYPALASTTLDNIDWTQIESVTAEDGKVDYRKYIWGYAGGESNIRLAAGSYLAYDCIKGGYHSETPLVLDEKIHEDYAKELIPRAVGYSTALIDYFFRGELEVSSPDQYVYSIIDGSISPQQFTTIKAKVMNTTTLPDENGNVVLEEAGSGELVAVAKYRKIPGYLEDLSNFPQDPAAMENLMANVPFSYSVSLPEVIDPVTNPLSSTVANEFIFDFSDDPVPAGITDLYLQVVFRGSLGDESDNAVAVGMKDLNEPMHLAYVNSTDKIYYYGNLLSDLPSDFTSDDFNAPINVSIGFYQPGGQFDSYIAAFILSPPSEDRRIPPGRYGRLIILTGEPSLALRRSIEAPLGTEDVDMVYTPTKNQLENEGWFVHLVKQYRGIYSHGGTQREIYYPDRNGIDSAPWPDLGPPVPATLLNWP